MFEFYGKWKLIVLQNLAIFYLEKSSQKPLPSFYLGKIASLWTSQDNPGKQALSSRRLSGCWATGSLLNSLIYPNSASLYCSISFRWPSGPGQVCTFSFCVMALQVLETVSNTSHISLAFSSPRETCLISTPICECPIFFKHVAWAWHGLCEICLFPVAMVWALRLLKKNKN